MPEMSGMGAGGWWNRRLLVTLVRVKAKQMVLALQRDLGSQKAAAQALGVSTSTLRRWQTGGAMHRTQYDRLVKVFSDVQRAKGAPRDEVERAFDSSREEILAVLDRLQSDVRAVDRS